ncbi:MAG: Uma2 family endonuclease [Armatimonadota bacterium]
MATAAQPVKHRVVSWEEYLNLPLTRYEIIDGEVIKLPTPTLKHQRIVMRLSLKIGEFVAGKRSGELFPAPFDFVIQRQPLRTRQPDLFYLSYERAGDLDSLIEQSRLEIAPDLVIEVLSPSDTYSAWRDKLRDYHALGVPEVWVVDIEKREIEVLVHEERSYRSLGWFTGEEAVLSTVLPELHLKPKEIFDE